MDYTDFITRLDNAHQYRNYITADCPFQDWQSHQPPFFVNERGYNCVACGVHGSLEWLDKKLGGRFYKNHETTKRLIVLPRWKQWADEYGSIQGIADRGREIYLRYPGKRLFFQKRKIDQFAEQGYFGHLDGWNLFPIFSPDGHIIDILVRGGEGTGGQRYVLRPDTDREHPYLYVPNWSAVRDASIVYVPYGIIDAWALYAIGKPSLTGTTGKAISPEALFSLHKYYIMVPDRGEEPEAREMKNKIGWMVEAIKELRYPDGCKDPDEVRRYYGNEKLLSLIEEE